MPSVAPALRAALPRLQIVWREDKTNVLVQALESGTCDAALVALEAELGDVEHETIVEDPFMLAVPDGHALARKTGPADPSELRTCDVLLLDEGHCFRDQALEVCSRAKAHEGEFRATSLATLVQMVAGGAGITMLPRVAVATEAARAGLHVRALSSPKARRTIALVWRRRSAVVPALRRVAEVLREGFPQPRPTSKRLADKRRERAS